MRPWLPSQGYGLEWCLTPLLPCLLCCFPSSHPVSDAAAALAPIEEHPPLAHQIETFSPQQVHFFLCTLCSHAHNLNRFMHSQSAACRFAREHTAEYDVA